FGQNSLNRLNLLHPAWVRHVDGVYQQSAVADLFECCAKRGKQIGRQCANKTDRVVDDDFLFAWQTQPSRRRIESRKHALLCVHVAFGQRVQKRGFSSVRITDYRDHRQALSCPTFATFLTTMTLRFDLSLETVDAIANATTIGFELCFTRTSTTDPTGQTRKRRILTRDQTRQQIFQLRQLDLDLSFFRLCTLREDVEDQLRSIDDFQIRRFGQRPHLRRRQFAIEDEHVRAELECTDDEFVELATSEHCAWIDCLPSLNDRVLDDHTRGRSELGKFRHRFFSIGERSGRDANQDRTVAYFRTSRSTAIPRHLFFERVDQSAEIMIEL